MEDLKNIFANIDNSADLKTLILTAKEYGFDFGHETELHTKYLVNIINKENKLNLAIQSDKLIKDLFKGSYSEFKEDIKNYFAQFGKEDKIQELLKNIGVAYTNVKSQIDAEYQKLIFKGFIDLGKEKREHELYWFITYDFTKPTLKLSVNDRNVYEFNRILSLLGFEFEIPYYSEYSSPKVWETEDFKIYKNHTLEIKNPKAIEELKKLLIEKYKNRDNINLLIKI